MTCHGCVNTIIKNLKKVQDISDVDVDFEQEKVKISISRDINILELQNFLSDKYTLNEPWRNNISAIMALLSVWNSNALKINNHANNRTNGQYKKTSRRIRKFN